MTTILALDQASRTSGWSVFTNGKLEAFGKITASEEDIGERLVYIKNEIKKLLEIYQPDFVLFEDIQLQSNVLNNVQTFKILAEVFGIVEELLTEEEIPHEAVLAGTWKSTLGIKGKNRAEQKKNAQQYVIDTYGVKPTQDECDAIAINAHYHSKNKKPINPHDWS